MAGKISGAFIGQSHEYLVDFRLVNQVIDFRHLDEGAQRTALDHMLQFFRDRM